MAGDLDLGEIFSSVHAACSRRTRSITSTVSIRWRARPRPRSTLHGHLNDFALTQPPEYKAVIRPQSVIVAITMAPSEFRFFGGSVVIDPNQILFDRLDFAPKHGSMRASGRIERPSPGTLELTNLDLELHHINAEEWLPDLIALDTMDVHAPASGNLALVRATNAGTPLPGQWEPERRSRRRSSSAFCAHLFS